jgi:hypothetical protein
VQPNPEVRQLAAARLPDDSISDIPQFIAIAREVPEFAGMYFNDDGRLTIALTALDRRAAAEGAVRSRIGNHETQAGRRDSRNIAFDSKLVKYSFLELARYKTVLRRSLTIRGVATIDANEVLNRVEVGLADPTAEESVRALADSLGITAEVLSFREAGYPQHDVLITGSTSGAYGSAVVEAGWRVSISSGGGQCTIGPTGIRGTNGDSVFITASHCTPSKWAYDGSTARQPDGTSTMIGTEILDPAAASCNFGLTTCRDSDAALFTATKPIRFGKIVRTADSVSCESCHSSFVVDSSLTITSTLSYVVSNEIIHKIGQTSGWTYGAVEATCVNYTWPVWPFDDETKCSDRIDMNSETGDSGGPAFSVVSGTNVQLRGINIGHDPVTSDAYISNLGQIAIDLGHLSYYDPGAPWVSITGPSEVPMGGWCSWQSAVTKGIPPFTYSWSGLLTGTGGAVSGAVYSSGTLQLTVTDFLGRQGNAYFNVTVAQVPPLCD